MAITTILFDLDNTLIDFNRNLLEGFYNIYLQEIEEMKSIKAVNKQLKELGGRLNGYTKTDDEGNEVFVEGQGYSKIENFSERGYQAGRSKGRYDRFLPPPSA